MIASPDGTYGQFVTDLSHSLQNYTLLNLIHQPLALPSQRL